ncbi:hypothetical protein [Alteromonas profundi]|uniref:hypothetical protein n=1 Tax=Alteromonas profundi TaxID=2696062 RepID=UPI001FEB887F|nr:hypothetical protein [Alteromonas profundi]
MGLSQKRSSLFRLTSLRRVNSRFSFSFSLSVLLCLLWFIPSAHAIKAGQYYYFISQQCVPKGPQTPKERGAVTPDLWLFEVSPAGLSDYFVHMNTDALSNYAEAGKAYLSDLEEEQAYTAGQSSDDNKKIQHDFMLQREAITLDALVDALSGFSQHQKEKGYYYRKILSLDKSDAMFKAVTKVQLIDFGVTEKLFLADYSSHYYLLDEKGKPLATPFISVDHKEALSQDIHPYKSPFNQYTRNGVCGERWVP